MEGEAVLAIINKCIQNGDEIAGSYVLDLEIDQIHDAEKREKIKYFYEKTITTKIKYSESILKRVHELFEQTNIRILDRFHLSFAEISGVDVFLTTDTKFEKAGSKLNLKMKITNPLKFLMEVIQNEYDT
jgi:predicted nucleic acid-binding protein